MHIHTRTQTHTQRLYASHAQINTNQIQSNLMPSWNNQSPACLHHVHKTYGEWVTQQVKRLPLRARRTNAMTTRRDASLQLLYIYVFKSDHERKQISRDFLSNSPPRVVATHIRRLSQIARTHTHNRMHASFVRRNFLWFLNREKSWSCTDPIARCWYDGVIGWKYVWGQHWSDVLMCVATF